MRAVLSNYEISTLTFPAKYRIAEEHWNSTWQGDGTGALGTGLIVHDHLKRATRCFPWLFRFSGGRRWLALHQARKPVDYPEPAGPAPGIRPAVIDIFPVPAWCVYEIHACWQVLQVPR